MRTPPTSPSKATAPAELPRAKSAPQLRDRDSPDNVQQTPPPVPPIQELPPAAVPGNPARAPASPNGGEARRTLTAVLDALMGTADGHRRDRALRLENGSRVSDYVRDHPDGAYTVRLFGDGFTIRREGDESLPKPPLKKRPRRGAVHSLHDDDAASPLQAYADHAAFLADVRDCRVPSEFRTGAANLVRLEVEDYLPSAYRDVHAYLDPFRRAQNGEPPLAKPETLSSEGRSSRLKRFDKS
jgi:hypothetical protein